MNNTRIITVLFSFFISHYSLAKTSYQALEKQLAKDPLVLSQQLSTKAPDNMDELEVVYYAEALHFSDQRVAVNDLLKDCQPNTSSERLTKRLITVKAQALWLLNEVTQAEHCVKHGLKYVNTESLKRWEDIWLYATYAKILSSQGKVQESQALLTKLFRYSYYLTDTFRKARVLELLSSAYSDLKEFEKAISFQQHAVNIYEQTNGNYYQTIGLYNLAQQHLLADNLKKALTFAQQSFKASKPSKDNTNTLYSAELIARIYEKQNQHQLGFELLHSLVPLNKHTDPMLKIIFLKKYGDLAGNVEQESIQVNAYRNALSIENKYNFKSQMVISIKRKLAAIYANKNEFEKAYRLLNSLQ